MSKVDEGQVRGMLPLHRANRKSVSRLLRPGRGPSLATFGSALAALSLLLPLSGCDGDSETRTFGNRPRGGDRDDDRDPRPGRGRPDAGARPTVDAGIRPDAGVSVDRNVFRPEERPATDAAIAALT